MISDLIETEIETLVVRFKNDLTYNDVKSFRGAVISLAGEDSLLFHNHDGQGFRYSYPVVQYKILDGKASVVCIETAVDSGESLFDGLKQDVRLGRKKMTLEVQCMERYSTQIGFTDRNILYGMKNWLPFNQDNYRYFLEASSDRERLGLMYSVLVGNILSLGKGLGIDFADHISADIISAEPSGYCSFKGIRMLAFDLDFSLNLSLPDYIGLGKGASLGFGIIEKKCIKFNI